MPNALRFLFSGNDLQKVNVASIQVEDVLPSVPAGSPTPGSMRLRFRQSDPGPVQIRPLLPGTIRFLVDPAAPGMLPDPTTGSFTEADYAGWKTLGRILVIVADRAAEEIAGMAAALPVKPNRVWYGPVRLPPGFLFETLTVGLKKAVIRAADGRTIRTTHADWRKYAIAEFLAGRYTPVLETSNDLAQDDRVRFVMPTVEVPADGNVGLVITTALAQNPQDAPRDTAFEEPVPPVGREEPLHPRNGLIPAREVYRRLRADMVADAAAAPLMDAILFDWPIGPRFFPIRFTRTAEPVDNCSAHFPRQIASIRSGAALLHEEKLPAHGVVFFRQAPPPVGQPAPAPPSVDISLTGTMKWLLGGGTSWRLPGQSMAVAIDLAAVVQPHLAVRLPMSDAMLSDTSHDDGCGLCCTYMSLRRTVRALIDNRIAGGRLNFGVRTTSAITHGIIRRAFEGTGASASIVANNAPKVARDADPNVESPKLIPVLEAFFPGDAPQHPFPGAPGNPIVFSRGRMLHDLWHSRLDEFQAPRQRANFPDNRIGRGGPGAAVEMGLASFHVDPMRRPGEADDVYFARITSETLVGLRPGAVLQFWLSNEDFEDMKAHMFDLSGAAFGHSPIFVAYSGPAGAHTGVQIIDQNGNSSRTVDAPPFPPLLGGDQVWISANWDE